MLLGAQKTFVASLVDPFFVECIIFHQYPSTYSTFGSPPKDERDLNKWSNRLTDALKGLAGEAVEALPAIVGSVVGAILSFLGKTVGFVAEHTWTLIVFFCKTYWCVVDAEG